MFEAGPSWVDSLFELKPGTRWKVGYYEWRTFPGTKDPPPPKEPWESPLERKARRHREKAVGFGIAVLRDRSGELLGILQASFGGRLGMYIKPLLDPITSYYNILFERWLWKKQQKCIFFLEGSVISWLAEFRVDTQSGLSDSTVHQKNIKNPSDSLIFYFDPRLEWRRLKRWFLLLRFLDVDVLLYPSFVASFLEKTWWSLWKLQVEAHKAAQKKIIEAYDPHKDAVFCRDLFAGLGMSSRVNQTIRKLVSIGCQPTKND